jgi:UDP-N-acetyl-D-mannosaminuronate dehydrogenase
VSPAFSVEGANRVDLSESALRMADLIVVLVDHDEFTGVRAFAPTTRILDTRRCLPPEANAEMI